MAGSDVPRGSVALVRIMVVVMLAAFAASCGGDRADAARMPAGTAQQAAAAADSFDPCALLSADEVAGALGWQPARVEPTRHGGGMGLCSYGGPESTAMSAMIENLEVGVQQCPTNMPCYEDLPDFRSSAELVAYRLNGYTDGKYGDLEVHIIPLEGMGVPAIDHELAGLRAIEMYIAPNRLAFVQTWASSDTARALAEKVLTRVR